jgi:hypothetical protein
MVVWYVGSVRLEGAKEDAETLFQAIETKMGNNVVDLDVRSSSGPLLYASDGLNDLCNICSCRAFPAGTLTRVSALLLYIPESRRPYHRENMLVRLNQTLHQYGLISTILQELLHLRRKLFQRLTPYGVDAHSLSEEDKVWVLHGCVRVPGVIEEV